MPNDDYGDNIHEQFVDWMKKEIYIMRELLSNMLEEELALVMWDEKSWKEVISGRSLLLKQLKGLHHEPNVDIYETFYDAYIEEDFELDMLKSQLVALTEKMTSQNVRNRGLFKTYGPNLGKPLPENWHQEAATATPKKKVKVSTIER